MNFIFLNHHIYIYIPSGKEIAEGSANCIHRICEANQELNDAIAKSDHPYLYGLAKQILQGELWNIATTRSTKGFLDRVKIVIISDGLNKVVDITTDRLNCPRLDNVVNNWLTQTIITAARSDLTHRIAEQISKRLF